MLIPPWGVCDRIRWSYTVMAFDSIASYNHWATHTQMHNAPDELTAVSGSPTRGT